METADQRLGAGSLDDLVEARHEIARLRVELEQEAVVGRATGVLMTRHEFDADRALAMMTRWAHNEECTLLDVASDIATRQSTAAGSTRTSPERRV